MADASPTALIRPMTEADVPAAERLSAAAYLEVDERSTTPGSRPPALRSPDLAEDWLLRTRHLLSTDPAGCWVAEQGDELAGFATSLRRELLWCLASYAVRPDRQGHGLGRQLFAAAAHYGSGCLRGMLNAGADPRALRLYRKAGFDLLPHLALRGTVAREVLPVVRHVREGTGADRDLLDALDRRLRGAAHGPDHELLRSRHRLLVVDRPQGSGYAYVDASGAVVLLAATHRKVATQLTWEALASSDPRVGVEIAHVSPANQWALDVAVDARLEIHTRGYLGLRRAAEPAPYLPHATLL